MNRIYNSNRYLEMLYLWKYMKNKNVLIVSLFFFTILLFSLACSKEKESSKSVSQTVKETLTDKRSPAPAGVIEDVTVNEKSKKMGKKQGLVTHFIAPMDYAKERLLEYSVKLTYESDNLLKSRRELLGIISKYGFIKNSTSSVEQKNTYMNTGVYVKTDLLYDALRDFEVLGILLNERITVNDHTENMVLNERKVKREQLRIKRKNRAAGQVTSRSKTWKDTEGSLEKSEDALDRTEHEKWKIKDKISWAFVHIYLKGPKTPDTVEVPDFSDAFVGMVNLVLQFFYLIINILPFIVFLLLIIWKRKRIGRIFLRRKKSGKE